MSNSNLVDVVVPAYEGNYTKGRSKKIEKITVHHMAGKLSAYQCGAYVFQTVGRKGSSNYGIGNDGDIGLYVDEENTPWSDGIWDSNCKSVTIEVSDCQTGGVWPVSDKALNSLIRLVADIAIRNNLGNLVKGKNLTWHRMYDSSNICPGDYLISKMDYICQEANKIINGSSDTAEEYFVPNGEYVLKFDKCIRTSPNLSNNILRAEKVDSFTKTLLVSLTGNAMLKAGTEIKCLNIIKENGRIWGSYGNCWVCLQNADGEKQATRIADNYFEAGGTYKLNLAKCIRTSPCLSNNILPAQKADSFTKTLLTSTTGNAMLKAGTEITCLKITKENGRIWGSYGNCWVCLQNDDGTKQATRI